MDEERTALQEITESIGYGHDSYEYSYRSRFSDDCCRWEGVHCSPTNSQVIAIYFYYIKKYVADEWFLDMSLFSKLKQLQELHLVGNNIGELDNPEAICELTNLRRLDLSMNFIEGEVPRCWSSMPSLRSLDLSENLFRGNLTPMLTNISKTIEMIDVSHNFFEGFVPFSIFANLSKLSHLDLSYNYNLEVETEDPNWHPSFQVQHLLLAACKLNNQSDHVIPSFLSTQGNLQTLDLSSNSLVGNFPTWMLGNISSVLSLRSNCFVGQLPEELENNSNITMLDVSDNLLDGNLPSRIDQILPRLFGFNASSNQFSGPIPLSFGELEHLERLDLSNNHLTGVVPANLTRNSSLWYLNLSNNSFDGEPLPGNCSMPKLAWLLLQHNLFVGEFPACLSNSLSLKLVDVRDNRLSGNISNLPALMQVGAFLVGRNRFSGQLPEQLCQMQRIQFLDFSNNGFSGNIPCCLRNNSVWKKKYQANSWVPIDFTTKGISLSYQGIPLTLMTGIDLSENTLVGPIPNEIGELSELHSLNLSNNRLTGHIPTSFENLKNLESLDLSHNNLTGPIPPGITQITTMAKFSVAFNNLSGLIPFTEQFSTFSATDFEGNPELCGEVLESKCSGNDDDDDGRKENSIEKAEESLIDRPLFFYSFVFVSYAVGFWGFLAPLCISVTLRRNYFAAIDGWIQYLFRMKSFLFKRSL
ncbi:hypothetical protein V6N13_005688 [Hibiscus sabdariffa]|uniref:Leucine-rich repeat-containing N-terminal plant-type domain-containing protein n=1 Tax=Hibiscus sabdariffa TaxID=183260 RepID=A0ABR2EPZ6_9ROSI